MMQSSMQPRPRVLDGEAVGTGCGATIAVAPSAGMADLTPQEAPTDLDCLTVHGLGLTVAPHRALLTDVTFRARRGSLTAIIGPSGAGKSTLAKLIGGTLTPTSGTVTFEGHHVHAEYASLRCRIGLVPQDDIVHRQLTVEQALDYAAELRLSHADKQERRRGVQRVLAELELTEHAHQRVDTLSGGQRKRVSAALELLISPSLLILDEPTSGLDPALDRQLMTGLRQLADTGLVVLVVTHSLTYLHVCDQVLLLAPGGKTAYCGPPDEIGSAMGASNWADIFAKIGADPDAAHREHLERAPRPAAAPLPARHGTLKPPRVNGRRQISMVARRQLRLLTADRGYFAFLAMLPFVLGALSLMVPGNAGLSTPDSRTPNEPAQILMLLNISAVFMGTALTIRDLVGERAIFRREQAVGLSASAYLLAKVVVYSIAVSVQSAVLVAIVVIGKGGPTRGAVVAGNPVVEMYLTIAATATIATLAGLAMSAAARSSEQILPMLVLSVMVSIVFSGGLIPVTGRMVLDQFSRLLPARWGFAATASTADLPSIAPLLPPNESLWTHSLSWWALDMAALTVIGIAFSAFARWQIRLKRCSPIRRVPAHRRPIDHRTPAGSRHPRTYTYRTVPGCVAAVASRHQLTPTRPLRHARSVQQPAAW